MPEYLFQHPDTKEVKSVLQRMTESHVYIDGSGVEWKRVFTNPKMSVDTKINEWDAKDFSRKTASKKGTLGNLWDASSELAEKRVKSEGVDPVAEATNKKEKIRRKGKVTPMEHYKARKDFGLD